MKTTWTVAAALFFFSIFASGQDRPSWEIFGGYQYTFSDYGPIQDVGTAIASNYGQTVSVDHMFTMTGGNVTLQKNIGNHWAAAIDIGGMSASKDADLSQYFQLLGYIPNGTTQVSTFKPNVYTIMGGPQFSLWKYRNAEVFLRGMGGALRSNLSMDETTRKALNFLLPNTKQPRPIPPSWLARGCNTPSIIKSSSGLLPTTSIHFLPAPKTTCGSPPASASRK